MTFNELAIIFDHLGRESARLSLDMDWGEISHNVNISSFALAQKLGLDEETRKRGTEYAERAAFQVKKEVVEDREPSDPWAPDSEIAQPPEEDSPGYGYLD